MTRSRFAILGLGVLMISTSFICCDGRAVQDLNTIDSVYLSYDHTIVPYSLYNPDTTFILDQKLNEVSALTILPDGNLATVEDENGIVFLLDNNGRLTGEIPFGEDGDFEGIEFLNGQLYVMESNGDIFSFNPDNAEETLEKVDTDFKGKNDLEGLGRLDNVLLIACKGDGEVEPFDPDGKGVYTVDPETYRILDLVIDVEEKDLEERLRKRHPSIDVHDFDPSAVAVNPVDGNIYLLSADMLLAVFKPNGELLEVVPLLAKMFRQPEGLTFTTEGEMYIASEASGGSPQLFLFSRK